MPYFYYSYHRFFKQKNLHYITGVQVRDEVEIFRPKVPLITALRNPGAYFVVESFLFTTFLNKDLN